MDIAFRFESSTDDFTGVLADSPIGHGDIASQNAGSINTGIYYQVGGGGVNGRFAQGLRPVQWGGPDELGRVNADLVARYDARYGDGAWQADRSARRTDRLTSLVVPLQHANTKVAPAVTSMVYSVGPVLQGPPPGAPPETPLITNSNEYRGIYIDALRGLAGVSRFRVSMISTGIYAAALPSLAEKQQLFREAAGQIIAAVAQVAATGDVVPATVLINNGQIRVAGQNVPLIRTGFAAAAEANPACTPVAGGFDLSV